MYWMMKVQSSVVCVFEVRRPISYTSNCCTVGCNLAGLFEPLCLLVHKEKQNHACHLVPG